MLPFVRGVDLSGNDFKVSWTGRVPGLPAGLLLRPARLASASCPARLQALRVPGTAAGAGVGLSPGQEWTSEASARCLYGETEAGQAQDGRLGSESRRGPGREPPPRVRVIPLGWTVAWGSGEPPRPREVTRPSQALTQGWRPGRPGAGVEPTHHCPLPATATRHPGPLRSLPLSEPGLSQPVKGLKSRLLGCKGCSEICWCGECVRRVCQVLGGSCLSSCCTERENDGAQLSVASGWGGRRFQDSGMRQALPYRRGSRKREEGRAGWRVSLTFQVGDWQGLRGLSVWGRG